MESKVKEEEGKSMVIGYLTSQDVLVGWLVGGGLTR